MEEFGWLPSEAESHRSRAVKFLQSSGARLSRVGLGTFQFGSGEWGYGEEYASQVAPQIVQRSLDLGVNVFDTAEVYGFGRSERILGAALRSRRSEAFVATKLFPVLPFDPVLRRRFEGSLRRLDTEAIDLYQLHWPNLVVPLSATTRALEHLKRAGKVRHVGVSNYSLARWRQAETLLGTPVLSNQVRYNLVYRRIERDLLPWAQRHDRLIISYSPLQRGLLSGRYGTGSAPRGVRGRSIEFLPQNLARIGPLLETLRRVAQAHDSSPAQVSLAWLIRRPNVVVIPGASSVAQAQANAEAADLDLTDDEDEELTAASDAYQPLGGVPAYGAVVARYASRLAERVRRINEGLHT